MYCFEGPKCEWWIHCGHEYDSIEKILSDATVDPRHYYAEHIGHDVGLKDDARVTEAFALSLIKRAQEVMKKF